MKKKTFHDGSFVVHGISRLSAHRISAWFDANGKPIDAEYMPAGRQVSKKHRSVWLSLESIGREWRI